MKFEVSSAELLKKLQLAAGVITANPVLPITEDFLFKLQGNNLEISATNLETTIHCNMVVKAHEEGVSAIPAKILLETLKNLPEQPVTLLFNPNNHFLELTSSYGRYIIAGNDPEDFPSPPEEENTESFRFSSERLLRAINGTIFATSNDEMRLHMSGINMQLDFNKVIFAATDAHKLVKYVFGDISTDIAGSCILPKKAVGILKNALPPEGEVIISFNKNNAFFNFDSTMLICRLIEAKFPDINAVIPVDVPYTLIVNRKDLLNSLRRIGIYASKATSQVMLNISQDSLTITAQDLDFSNEATEQLPCKYDSAEPITIGYSSKYMIEILSVLSDEEVVIKITSPTRPSLIYPFEQEKNEEITMLLMPVFSTYA